MGIAGDPEYVGRPDGRKGCVLSLQLDNRWARAYRCFSVFCPQSPIDPCQAFFTPAIQRRSPVVSAQQTNRIAQLLRDHEPEILAEWVGEQTKEVAGQRGRIADSELREQSREFLGLLRQASSADGVSNPNDPVWQKVTAMLAGLSHSRARQGFTPSETATFVFSLKRPLFARLTRARQGTRRPGRGDLGRDELLDRLGLYTTEGSPKPRRGHSAPAGGDARAVHAGGRSCGTASWPCR